MNNGFHVSSDDRLFVVALINGLVVLATMGGIIAMLAGAL